MHTTFDTQPIVLAPAAAHQVRPFVVVALLLGTLAALPCDVACARFFLQDSLPGELSGLILRTEFFGHAYGLLGIAITIFLLDESRRRLLPRLLAIAISAGLTSDLVKLLVHRVRPCGFSFLPGEPTFLGLSFWHSQSWREFVASTNHSFPSAHTAMAVGLAIALGWMYPRGARWFLVLSVMVAASRCLGGAHYISDTFFGGLVGYSVAGVYLGRTRISQWWTRIEQGRTPTNFGTIRRQAA